MIMMFVLVQAATGGTASRERSAESMSQISPYVQARADFDPRTHQVTVQASPPASIWDSTADLRRRSPGHDVASGATDARSQGADRHLDWHRHF
jgi:hypothetical protein